MAGAAPCCADERGPGPSTPNGGGRLIRPADPSPYSDSSFPEGDHRRAFFCLFAGARAAQLFWHAEGPHGTIGCLNNEALFRRKPPMSPQTIQLPLLAQLAGFRRFSVAEYHRLIDIGLLT